MSSYPVLNQNNLNLLQQAYPKVVAPQVVEEKPETPVSQPIDDIEASLEPVQTNEKFLKKLANSKKKVLKQAKSLQRFSYGMGGIAILLAAGSLVSAMSLKYQAKKADMEAQTGEGHMLQSSKSGFNLHSLSWSSLISTMIWSLVAAKAKSGISAASKPESVSIKAAAKKGIFMVVLIAIATGMKLSGDNQMLDEFFNDNIKGLSLAQQSPVVGQEFENEPYWADEQDVDDFDWEEAGEWYPNMDDDEDIIEEIEETEEDLQKKIEEIEAKLAKLEEEAEENKPRRRHGNQRREFDDEEEWEPRRKHGKKHGRHHRRGGHHVEAPKKISLYEQIQTKYQNDPQALKREIKVAGVFTGVFVLAIAVSYLSLLNTYKKSVAKHEFLLSIYQNPNAKVVPQHQAKEFIAKKTYEVQQKKALKAQMAAQEHYNKQMQFFQQ
eukprot:scpid78907/ scgid24523/ 